jgi:hypothetical protein
VPTVSCQPGATEDSSQWIGIDGDGSNTVEQDGTEADCENGTPVYDAWYELYAQHGSPVDGGYEDELSPAQYPVSPGDVISASVSVSGSTWTFTLVDSTHPWSGGPFSTSVNWSAPREESVEWIVERPEVGSSLTDLADFGAVNFSGASATGGLSTGGISAFSFAPIEMVNGSDLLSAPGALSANGGAFTDTWYASN